MPSQSNGRKLLGVRDVIFSIAVIAAAAFAYFLLQSGNGGSMAIVTADGNIAAEISLDRDGTYQLDCADMKLTVRDGMICVSHSDCPDKLCEKTGYIGADGQTVVCLPNRVSVRIISEENGGDDIDVVLN